MKIISLVKLLALTIDGKQELNESADWSCLLKRHYSHWFNLDTFIWTPFLCLDNASIVHTYTHTHSSPARKYLSHELRGFHRVGFFFFHYLCFCFSSEYTLGMITAKETVLREYRTARIVRKRKNVKTLDSCVHPFCLHDLF